MVQVNVRIPPELHDRLTAEATATTATVTAVVTRALEVFLSDRPTKRGKTK
jgi:predicted HicB family RNase H-like nuclease